MKAKFSNIRNTFEYRNKFIFKFANTNIKSVYGNNDGLHIEYMDGKRQTYKQDDNAIDLITDMIRLELHLALQQAYSTIEARFSKFSLRYVFRKGVKSREMEAAKESAFINTLAQYGSVDMIKCCFIN